MKSRQVHRGQCQYVFRIQDAHNIPEIILNSRIRRILLLLHGIADRKKNLNQIIVTLIDEIVKYICHVKAGDVHFLVLEQRMHTEQGIVLLIKILPD